MQRKSVETCEQTQIDSYWLYRCNACFNRTETETIWPLLLSIQWRRKSTGKDWTMWVRKTVFGLFCSCSVAPKGNWYNLVYIAVHLSAAHIYYQITLMICGHNLSHKTVFKLRFSHDASHPFHATSCLSHNRWPFCHSNPLTGCGDWCPGVAEGVVAERERQRHRGRAGGLQKDPSAMKRSAAEVFYRPGPIHKILSSHVSCTCARVHALEGDMREWSDMRKQRRRPAETQAHRLMSRLFDEQNTRWCLINYQNVLRCPESSNEAVKEVATKL